MLQKLLRFLLLILLVVGVLYLAHRVVLLSFFEGKNLELMHFGYQFNFGITLLFTSTMILASQKLKDQLGFLFLAETVIKIGLFLYLAHSLGFDPDKSNFFDFFVPYIGCLLVEIYMLLRLLKAPKSNNSK